MKSQLKNSLFNIWTASLYDVSQKLHNANL